CLTEEELINQLLTEAHTTLKQITVIVDEINSKLASLQRRIECGEIRRDVEAETLRWLAVIQEQCLSARFPESEETASRSKHWLQPNGLLLKWDPDNRSDARITSDGAITS